VIRRFRPLRILIVGCGDVGMRVARQLAPRVRQLALTTTAQHVPALRAAGITPLLGNLDAPHSLRRLAGLATHLLYLAPPPSVGSTDPRSARLVQALRRRRLPRAVIYLSTTGVYGDCGGSWVDESRPLAPATARARRRVSAEREMRRLGRADRTRVGILRAPGIYAAERGQTRARLLRGTPVLRAQDDVYTNHIHADDLARACILALWRAKPQRIYHVSDQSQLKMGDWFDQLADHHSLPRPPRITRKQALEQLPLTLLSFMSESRRLRTTRLQHELRVRLRYPVATPL